MAIVRDNLETGSTLGSNRSTCLVPEVVTSREKLETYASEWNELLASSEADSIFLTWEWISTWLDAVHPDADLFVVLARTSDGQLVGIAPFYLSTMRALKVISLRCLRVIGDSQAGGEYADLISRRGMEHEVLHCIAASLAEHSVEWDCLWVPCAATWTGARDRWHRLMKSGLFRERVLPCTYISLPATFDEYVASLSKKLCKNIRRAGRALASMGTESLVRCDNEDDIQATLTEFIDLHTRRWQSVGQQGSFVRRPRMTAFYRRFAPIAFRRGWLRCYSLRVGERCVAMRFGFMYKGVYHGLQSGYDPEVPNTGHFILHKIVEDLINSRATGYDFLAGVTDHKVAAGGLIREAVSVFGGKRSLRNKVLSRLGIWPTGRYIEQGPPESFGRGHD